MRKSYLLLIVFSMITFVNLISLPFITDIQDLISLGHDVGDIVAGNVPLKSLFVNTINPVVVIMETVSKMTEQITNLGRELNSKLDIVLRAVLVKIPLEGKIDNDMKELIRCIVRIDKMYENFEIYMDFLEDYNERTLRQFTGFVTTPHSGNLPDLLDSILLIIVPPRSALQRASLLENIKRLRNVNNPLELCDLDISFQYRLYKIHGIVMITELKAFIMTMFAYKLLSDMENTTYKAEIRMSQARYIMRSDQYLLEIKKMMQGASREIYRCSPNEFIAGENFIELEGLITVYVINEYQMSSGYCSNICFDYKNVESHQDCYTYTETDEYGDSTVHYCAENPCHGRIINCGWIGGDVNLCENSKGSLKRYKYVTSHTNGRYGKWTDCLPENYKVTSSFYNGNLYSCDVCLCTCSEENAESLAIRTFSLRPQLSNIEENMVVSDIRFVLKDKMIHIQIEESPLLATGALDKNNTVWVPLEDFVYLSNVTGGTFVKKEEDQYISLKENVDFSFVKLNHRTFNLDEISAGPGYVVTGVRLNLETPSEDEDAENNSPFQLEIHVTPFNYSSGQLIPTDENPSLWLTPKTQPNPPREYTENRTKLTVPDRINYDGSTIFNPNTVKNQYVEFWRSNHFDDDAGQTTVPLLDSRSVTTNNFLAFDGIGTIYHENEEFAGFIALKVLTITLVDYVQPNLKKSQIQYYKKLYRRPLRHNPAKA